MQVFELKEGRLNLWWERFRLWEMFRKEIRSNEELMIALSISDRYVQSHLAWKQTSRTNGTEKFGRSGNSEKSRQYFERNLLFAFCSLF